MLLGTGKAQQSKHEAQASGFGPSLGTHSRARRARVCGIKLLCGVGLCRERFSHGQRGRHPSTKRKRVGLGRPLGTHSLALRAYVFGIRFAHAAGRGGDGFGKLFAVPTKAVEPIVSDGKKEPDPDGNRSAARSRCALQGSTRGRRRGPVTVVDIDRFLLHGTGKLGSESGCGTSIEKYPT
jgi:hypothetical protein